MDNKFLINQQKNNGIFFLYLINFCSLPNGLYNQFVLLNEQLIKNDKIEGKNEEAIRIGETNEPNVILEGGIIIGPYEDEEDGPGPSASIFYWLGLPPPLIIPK